MYPLISSWFSILPDVFLFVLLSDQYVASVRLQLVSSNLPQDLLVHREVHLQTTLLQVVIPGGWESQEGSHPHQLLLCAINRYSHTFSSSPLPYNYSYTYLPIILTQ